MRSGVTNNLMQWVTIGGLTASLNLVHAQTAVKTVPSTSSHDRVATLPAVEVTTPPPAKSVPPWGNFYPAQFPGWPPMPGNLNPVSVWGPGDGPGLVDAWKVDASAASKPVPGKGRFLPAGRETAGTEDSPAAGPRLNVSGETNGITPFNLHDLQAGEAYAVRSKNSLIIPEWKIEPALSRATNPDQDVGSQVVPVSGPVNLLFLWRRDGAGNRGLFFNVATTNSGTGAVYDCRIGVNYGAGSYGGHPFVIQGGVSF
jgi:hypothetical protein